jgi:hypothetical protein
LTTSPFLFLRGSAIQRVEFLKDWIAELLWHQILTSKPKILVPGE